MSAIQMIVEKLKKELQTEDVQLNDFSQMHAGHAGLNELAHNLHLQGTIKSEKFKGLNRLARERLVYSILKDEMASELIHALTLKLEE